MKLSIEDISVLIDALEDYKPDVEPYSYDRYHAIAERARELQERLERIAYMRRRKLALA